MKVRLRLFALYRDLAGWEEQELALPQEATVGMAIEHLRAECAGLRHLPQRVLAAVNMEYVPLDHPLADGDELALIPPVAGGAEEKRVRGAILDGPIVPERLLAEVQDKAAGGVVLFLGTVREFSRGRRVVALRYEAYREIALLHLERILYEAHARWDLVHLVAEHRVGELGLGEVAVAVAVSAPHRRDAFEAARFVIDTLKERLPIWKKESYQEGEEWQQPTP